jgi:hypothetical protein
VTTLNLSREIDSINEQFTSSVKNRLQDLSRFSEAALEWLMMEHFQFSSRNTGFLSASVTNTMQFNDRGIAEELQRNFNEEKNHAKIYKKSLSEIGTDVEQRREFKPTTEFFNTLSTLISANPSKTLGTMYATETAAIFEHEVFWEISREVMRRRNMQWGGSRLKAFHDLHLNGVEQGHKDGLGLFVDADNHDEIENDKVRIGAMRAIAAMAAWWTALLAQAETI